MTWSDWLAICAVGIPVAYLVTLWVLMDKAVPAQRKLLHAGITAILWPIELICWLWWGLYKFYRAIGRVGADLFAGIR